MSSLKENVNRESRRFEICEVCRDIALAIQEKKYGGNAFYLLCTTVNWV